MYVNYNFRSKAALKAAIKEGAIPITCFQPGLGSVPRNGTVTVEGPHFPEPHRWYATVKIENGRVVKVVS